MEDEIRRLAREALMALATESTRVQWRDADGFLIKACKKVSAEVLASHPRGTGGILIKSIVVSEFRRLILRERLQLLWDQGGLYLEPRAERLRKVLSIAK